MLKKETLSAIFRDSFNLISEYADPPSFDSADTDVYWKELAERQTEIVKKHDYDQLAEKMMILIFETLEREAYRKTTEGRMKK